MRSCFSDISWFWLELAVSACPHPGAFVSVFCQDEFAPHGLRPVIPEANIAFNRQKGALLSFTVRLIQNLNARLQRFLPAGHLAEEACHTEIDVLKEPIGKQDQYASAFGGVNQFVFHSDGRTTVQRIFLPPTQYKGWRLPCSCSTWAARGRPRRFSRSRPIIWTGRRFSRRGGPWWARRTSGIKLPQDGDVDAHGLLLHEAWLGQTVASKITSDVIDAYPQKGLEAGGSETSRRRGGGFLLFYYPPRARRFF